MEYKLLKPITPRIIFDHLDGNCTGAFEGFRHFLNRLETETREYSLNSEIGQTLVERMILQRPAWRDFLLESSLIEECRPEKTYSIGDKFRNRKDGTTLMIASMGVGCVVNLITVRSFGDNAKLGLRRNVESITVSNIHKITSAEFDRIGGPNHSKELVRITVRQPDSRDYF